MKRTEKKIGDEKHARGKHHIGDCRKRDEGRILVTYELRGPGGGWHGKRERPGIPGAAASAPQALRARGLADRGAEAPRGLGVGCGAEGEVCAVLGDVIASQ